MTFTELELACKGYETRMARLKEVPRIIAAVLMNVNRKENSPAIQVEDVFPLYTDKAREPLELMSKDEYLEYQEFRKKIIWQTRN